MALSQESCVTCVTTGVIVFVAVRMTRQNRTSKGLDYSGDINLFTKLLHEGKDAGGRKRFNRASGDSV